MSSFDDVLREAVREVVRQVVREDLLPELHRIERAPEPARPRGAAGKLTTGGAAKLAGVTPETIRVWAERGRFPTARDAETGRLIIERAAFERFLVEREAVGEVRGIDIRDRARKIIGSL